MNKSIKSRAVVALAEPHTLGAGHEFPLPAQPSGRRDMFPATFALVAGACIGALTAYASVPRDRVVPRVAGGFLTFLTATTLILVEPGSYVAAVLVILIALASFIVCAANLWQRAFGKIESFGWFLTQQALRPKYLVQRYEETIDGDGSPSAGPGSSQTQAR